MNRHDNRINDWNKIGRFTFKTHKFGTMSKHSLPDLSARFSTLETRTQATYRHVKLGPAIRCSYSKAHLFINFITKICPQPF